MRSDFCPPRLIRELAPHRQKVMAQIALSPYTTIIHLRTHSHSPSAGGTCQKGSRHHHQPTAISIITPEHGNPAYFAALHLVAIIPGSSDCAQICAGLAHIIESTSSCLKCTRSALERVHVSRATRLNHVYGCERASERFAIYSSLYIVSLVWLCIIRLNVVRGM